MKQKNSTAISHRPFVSVILPSYNHANFVTAAIESVLGQSFHNIELIVVDDGSTDGTPEMVAAITDKRVKLVRLEQNRLRQTRNLAIKMAEGNYIAFQNSDDEWLQDKLQAQIDVLEKRRDVSVCFTGVELIDENNQIVTNSWANGLFTTKNRSNISWLRLFFEQGNCLCITSAVIRRDKLDSIGLFNGSLIQVSDFDLWIRLAATGQFHIVEEKLTRMRIVGVQKSQLGTDRNLELLHWAAAPMMRQFRRAAGLVLPVSIKSRVKTFFDDKNIHVESTDQNLSAPKASTTNRAAFEFAEVLENFSKYPIQDLLPLIFADVMPTSINTVSTRKAWLIKYAWTKKSPAHHLFANVLMAAMLANDTVRGEITSEFGAEIVKEYINRRGELSLRFQLMDKKHGI